MKFYFDQHVLTLMVSGHKSIVTDNLNFEFFPGTFYIPERATVHTVHIPNATFDNPTKCLVLALDPGFLSRYYEQIRMSERDATILKQANINADLKYFFSNDHRIIESFVRLYEHRLLPDTRANQMITTLLIQELLLRIFQTEGHQLLVNNAEQSIGEKSIQASIAYIKNHLQEKITVEKLAEVAELGMTTFYKKFKASTGQSPVEYLLRARIRNAKILIEKNQLSLKEIAYKSGFNSYEYFCSSFKKLEHLKPREFKQMKLVG